MKLIYTVLMLLAVTAIVTQSPCMEIQSETNPKFIGYAMPATYFNNYDIESTRTLTSHERKLIVSLIYCARDWIRQHPQRNSVLDTHSKFYKMLVHNEPELGTLDTKIDVFLEDVHSYFQDSQNTASETCRRVINGCFLSENKQVEEILNNNNDLNIDCVAMGERTPLLAACSKGDQALVHLLLKRGADPNKSTSRFRSPIENAVVFGNVGILHILILYADINQVTLKNLSSLAQEYNQQEIKLLLQQLNKK